MPDPLTVTAAITLAGKAVNQVSKLVQSGREIERLGWFNPISESNSYSIKEELILKWLKILTLYQILICMIFDVRFY